MDELTDSLEEDEQPGQVCGSEHLVKSLHVKLDLFI